MLFNRKNKHLRLALPELSFCDASRGGFAEWVQGLPRVSPAALADKLISAGEEIATQSISVAQASAIASQLDPTLDSAIVGLKALSLRFKTDNSPLIRLSRLGAIYGQLNFLAAQVCQQSKQRQVDFQRLEKSCQLLSESVIASFKIYQPTSTGCWENLHTAYRTALLESRSHKQISQISDTYQSIVALTCASPEKLNPLQIQTLYELLAQRTSSIRIFAEANGSDNFQVCLNSDKPPARQQNSTEKDDRAQDIAKTSVEFGKDKARCAAADTIYIDFEQLLEDPNVLEATEDLQQHLKQSYGPPLSRMFNRIEDKQELNACIGLSSIHYYLSGECSLEEFIKRKARAFSEKREVLADVPKAKSENQGEGSDIWNGAFTGNWQESEFNGDVIELEIQSTDIGSLEEPKEFPLFDLRSIDTNPKGYCLTGVNFTLRGFKPGNLIGLFTAQSKQLQVGTVRWTTTQDQDRKLGVELLPPTVEAAAIKILHSKNGTDFLPALFIKPAVKRGVISDSDSDYIIFPNVGFNGKGSASLILGDSEDRIVLSECVERTGDFCRYTIKYNNPDDE